MTDDTQPDVDGVEHIGDLLRTRAHQQSLSWPQTPLSPTRRNDTHTPRSPDQRGSPAGGLPPTPTTSCPHCSSEHVRLYRPGAPQHRPKITSPEAAADILTPQLAGLDREHCVTLNLDTKHRLIAATTVSIGSIDHTFMSPREAYRDALLHGAAAIVVAHNHPSGDPEPSRDDEHVTRRLADAGQIIGITILDHLVIGHDRWISLARRGHLTGITRNATETFRRQQLARGG